MDAEYRNHVVRLRLYVAGSAPNSLRAKANLDAICREHLDGNAAVEVVDVIDEPLRALGDGIIVTPTLVKVAPEPTATMIGDLSERSTVLLAIGLHGGAA